MELNITEFFNNGDHWMNSNSVSNLGQDAGNITWDNAKNESKEFFFITSDNKPVIQEYIEGFGAWDWEEITAWNDIELNALVLQFISSEINDLNLYILEDGDIDWDAVEDAQNAGQIGSNLFKTDDNEYYYYIGH